MIRLHLRGSKLIRSTPDSRPEPKDEPEPKRVKHQSLPSNGTTFIGTTGELVVVERSVDQGKLREELQLAFDSGIRSLAVALMHSYTFRVRAFQKLNIF